MEVKFGQLKSIFTLLVVCMSLVVGSESWARTVAIDYEKAKLVSKFVKHVGWPADAIKSEFVIGVYQNTEKHKNFKDYFADKGIGDKEISVRLVETMNEANSANILFIPSNKKRAVILAHRILNGLNVLIVTENSNKLDKVMVDISSGKQKSEMLLTINDANIAETALKVPKLAYFLGQDKSGDILSVSPTVVLKNQISEQLLTLQDELTQKKSSLAQLSKKLNVSKENSKKSDLNLKKETERLNVAYQENIKQSEEIKSKDEKLQNLEKRLQTQQTQLQQAQLAVQQAKLQTEEIVTKDDLPVLDKSKINTTEVTDLTKKLKKQNEITNDAVLKLTNITKENESLSIFKLLFYIFVVIAIIALSVAYVMWKKTKGSAVASTFVPFENEENALLTVRETQLTKSENLAALGYIATDITYAVGVSLEDLQGKLESLGDVKSATTLKPVVALLETFNVIAADQDDTEIQSFDVIAYVNKMVMLYDFEFSQSAIVYHYSGERALTIKSVPSYIALILLNLINNSLKHGFDNNGNGKIALKLEASASGGVEITYSDDGKGMSQETSAQVFNPFFTTQSDRGYVGIGMSTVHDLVTNKLSGAIKIESEEGAGTTVTVTLP